MRRIFVTLSLFAAVALGGCGVTGGLKTPPPLFSDKNKTPEQKTEPQNTQTGTTATGQGENTDLQDILDQLEE